MALECKYEDILTYHRSVVLPASRKSRSPAWKWQQKEMESRLNEVGGPIVPLDYSGQNVTLDFQINMGKLAGNATLGDLLNTQGNTLCYTY
jgi:hypothetical protein